MSSIAQLSQYLHGMQLVLGLYSLRHSYVAVRQLQQYENMAEVAAMWSKEARQQLHKTRTTQASGAIAIVVSVSSSVIGLFLTAPSIWKLLLNIANVSFTASAQQHIANFWDPKMKIPFIEGFNEAIEQTRSVKLLLKVLVASWFATSMVALKDMSMNGLLAP